MHALLCWPRSSNGAYVYVHRKAVDGRWPVFLYLYRDPKTGELVWIIGFTGHGKPEEVNDPDNSASKDYASALFDSSPSAKGACALNGPASPACKWRECNNGGYGCYAYPKSTGYNTKWYGASDSLKVVVGGKCTCVLVSSIAFALAWFWLLHALL